MQKLLTVFLTILFFSICATFYALSFRGVLGNPDAKTIVSSLEHQTSPFESSHERAPYALILSLDQNKSFSLTRELADLGAPDVGFHNDKFYVFFPPGVSLLAYPFYTIGKMFGMGQIFAYAVMPVVSVISLIFIFKISKNIFRLPSWAALLNVLVFAFATTSWSYAITIYQHAVTVLLMTSSFYGVWKYKKSKGMMKLIYGCYVWFAYSIGVFFDYPNVILLSPILIYFFVSSFSLSHLKNKIKLSFSFVMVLSAIVFLLINGLHAYYNYTTYGHWSQLSNRFARYERDKFDLLGERASSREYEKLDLGKGKELINKIYNEEDMPYGLSVLLLADDKGLFFFSPILLIAILGFFSRRKRFSVEDVFLAALVLINVISYASFRDPWGGWAYGPRYIIPSMAILALYVGVFAYQSKHVILSKIIIFVLFAYSCFTSLLGAMTTNIIPPKIEAIPLKLPYYNFLLNLELLLNGDTGSLIYQLYVSKYVPFQQYFLTIFSALLLLVFMILFVIPLFHKDYES